MRDLSLRSLDLRLLNSKLAFLSQLTANLGPDGVLGNAGVDNDIPRISLTSYKPFAPVLTAGVGTFSGTTDTALYALRGDVMRVIIRLLGCTVSAVTASLRVAIPAGYSAQDTCGTSFGYNDNGTTGTGQVEVAIASNVIFLFKDILAAGTWAIAAAASSFEFQFEFRVRR